MSLVQSINSLKNCTYVRMQGPQPLYYVVRYVQADGIIFSGRNGMFFLPLNLLERTINANLVHAYSTKEELPPDFVEYINSLEPSARIEFNGECTE